MTIITHDVLATDAHAPVIAPRVTGSMMAIKVAAGATIATGPRFKSTAAFAARRRTLAPTVERATFVTFMIGERRLAAAVESVERVLRGDAVLAAGASHVTYAGREVPIADLAGALACDAHRTAASRVLVVALPAGWIAVVVDAVHEIATVDAASIAAVAQGEPAALVPGVRGTFLRHDHEILVLDIARALGFRHS